MPTSTKVFINNWFLSNNIINYHEFILFFVSLSGWGNSFLSLINTISLYSKSSYCLPVGPKIYNLSNSILGENRFFNETVLPHSLGPDIIHLRFSGKGA